MFIRQFVNGSERSRSQRSLTLGPGLSRSVFTESAPLPISEVLDGKATLMIAVSISYHPEPNAKQRKLSLRKRGNTILHTIDSFWFPRNRLTNCSHSATRTGKPYCGLAVGSTPTRPTKVSHHCSSASASKTLCQALAEHMISALCRDEAFHKKGPAPFDVEPTPDR